MNLVTALSLICRWMGDGPAPNDVISGAWVCGEKLIILAQNTPTAEERIERLLGKEWVKDNSSNISLVGDSLQAYAAPGNYIGLRADEQRCTFGCLLSDENSKEYLLTAEHPVYNADVPGNGLSGSPIYANGQSIATLSAKGGLFRGANVDCAAAETNQIYRQPLCDGNFFSGKNIDIAVGARVEKCGAPIPQFTTGTVCSKNACLVVEFDINGKSINVTMKNQIVIEGMYFGTFGSSGSLVVASEDEHKGDAVGVLYAGTTSKLYHAVCPIEDVLSVLSAELGVKSLRVLA